MLSFTDWAVVEVSSEDLPMLDFFLHNLKQKQKSPPPSTAKELQHQQPGM